MTKFYTLWVSAAQIALESFPCLVEPDPRWRVWAGLFAIVAADAQPLIDDSGVGVLVYLQSTRCTALQAWGIKALFT